MPREVSYTDEALSDLDAIARWLTQRGAGRVARERLQAMWTALERLRDHPCRFPIGEYPGIRELPSRGYRVFYQVAPDTGRNETAGDVRILRIFGPGQRRDYI